jgi:carboxyl-terminal processing protease
MRIPVVVALVVLAAACAPSEAEPAVAPTVESSTTSPSTTTTVVNDELTTVSCPTESEFRLLCEAYDLIGRNYVDPIDDEALADAALEGLRTVGITGTQPGPLTCAIPAESFERVCEELERRDVAEDGIEALLFGIAEFGLDSNSAYITPAALALIQEEQTGSVEGIGALVTTEDLTSADPSTTTCNILSETCRLVIVSTLPSSPALAAGVQVGDEFVAVNGDPVAGRSVDEITAIVRGPAGTDVTITFARNGSTVDITITRAAITIPVTEFEAVGDVGYLRLNFFTGNAGGQVERDLQVLLDGGARTIIFDLRDNPGGTLDAALDVTSEFLADGLVVRTVGPEKERSYAVRGNGIATDPDIEVIVLVNRGSASASEVLAGALQERGRATIVGETTFGKNTVQQRFALSNGGAMRLTIARWITAGGLDFDNGIVPDVSLTLDASLTPAEIIELVVG